MKDGGSGTITTRQQYSTARAAVTVLFLLFFVNIGNAHRARELMKLLFFYFGFPENTPRAYAGIFLLSFVLFLPVQRVSVSLQHVCY